jgi:acid stress-induced BolA-like protein IbaG/YrbA
MRVSCTMIAPSSSADRAFRTRAIDLRSHPDMDAQQIADLIRRSIPDARVDVYSEDNTHFSALLVGAAFEGLRPLARHQLVYRALGERMGREIHALSIEAYTPQEWAARSAGTPGRG